MSSEASDSPPAEPGLLDAQLAPELHVGPWAMQIAVRYDKAALPSHSAVCAAAARAVVTLLADERSRGDGPWAPAVRRWRDGRIRKLVRRARGVRWDRVQDLPGVSIEQDGAQVRAFVPLPARPLPPALEQLQVSGTVYPRLKPNAPRDAGRGPVVVMVAVSPHVDVSTGKAAAQCAHAAQLSWEYLVRQGASETLKRWYDDEWRVRVVDDVTRPQWRR